MLVDSLSAITDLTILLQNPFDQFEDIRNRKRGHLSLCLQLFSSHITHISSVKKKIQVYSNMEGKTIG